MTRPKLTTPESNRWNLGPLSGKSADTPHKRIKSTETVKVAPRTICAASSTQPLNLAHEWRGAATRPGADDHYRYKSKGLG